MHLNTPYHDILPTLKLYVFLLPTKHGCNNRAVRAISSDRLRVVSGSDDNRVLVWDKNSKQLLQELKGHEGKVIYSLLFIFVTQCITLVLTICKEIEVKLLDRDYISLLCLCRIQGHNYYDITEEHIVLSVPCSLSTGKCCKNAERGAYFNSFP